jgi:hypothetical protein
MPFPKFTSGRSGRLTFDTLNELFSRVEALEGNSERKRWSVRPQSDAFFARVGVNNTGNTSQWAFTEVNRLFNASGAPLDPASWSDVVGGRNSSGTLSNGTVSTFAYPLVGTGLSTGDIHPVVATYNSEGDLLYVPIVASGTSSSFPAQIISNTVVIANLRWQYTCKRVFIDTAGTGWAIPSGGTQFNALNGPEFVSDAAPVYGVGMQPPQSGTLQMIRQPIRAGVIVMMALDATGRHFFSMPNGYKVIC